MNMLRPVECIPFTQANCVGYETTADLPIETSNFMVGIFRRLTRLIGLWRCP